MDGGRASERAREREITVRGRRGFVEWKREKQSADGERPSFCVVWIRSCKMMIKTEERSVKENEREKMWKD